MYNDINLWFAKDSNGNIVTIDKIDKNNKHEKYTCPICGSEVIAKTGDIMSWHFAHRDASKCSNEAQVHFWVKNELIKKGDKFKIKLDDEIKEFICKEILIEQSYKTEFGIYKPDITITTEDNEVIYFEVANTNKKKIEEYLDIWLDLNNIVVEVDTKDLTNGNNIKEFKAIFFKDKCFNINKDEKEYYELIGDLKLKVKKGKYPKEEMDKLNWLWNDIKKYNLNELDISELSSEIQSIQELESKKIVVEILKKKHCKKILSNYIDYNKNKIIKDISNNGRISYFEIPRKIYDRVYGKYDVIIKTKTCNPSFYEDFNNIYDKVDNFFEIYNFIFDKVSEYCDNIKLVIEKSNSKVGYSFNINLGHMVKNIPINNYKNADEFIMETIDKYNQHKENKKIGTNLKHKYKILLYNYLDKNLKEKCDYKDYKQYSYRDYKHKKKILKEIKKEYVCEKIIKNIDESKYDVSTNNHYGNIWISTEMQLVFEYEYDENCNEQDLIKVINKEISNYERKQEENKKILDYIEEKIKYKEYSIRVINYNFSIFTDSFYHIYENVVNTDNLDSSIIEAEKSIVEYNNKIKSMQEKSQQIKNYFERSIVNNDYVSISVSLDIKKNNYKMIIYRQGSRYKECTSDGFNYCLNFSKLNMIIFEINNQIIEGNFNDYVYDLNNRYKNINKNWNFKYKELVIEVYQSRYLLKEIKLGTFSKVKEKSDINKEISDFIRDYIYKIKENQNGNTKNI